MNLRICYLKLYSSKFVQRTSNWMSPTSNLVLVQHKLALSKLVLYKLVLSKWVHFIQVLSMLALSSCFPAKTIRWASIGIPSLSANLLFRFATVSLCSASKVMVLPVRVFTNVWILFWVSLRGSIIPLTNQGEPLNAKLINFILIFKVRLVCCIWVLFEVFCSALEPWIFKNTKSDFSTIHSPCRQRRSHWILDSLPLIWKL